MEESNKNLLSSFMKKQININTDKNQKGQNSFFGKNVYVQKDAIDEKKLTAEEEEAAEELEEAKKLSRSKAAEQNQTRMLKKLVLDNLLKYTALITCLIILSMAVITLGPALMQTLHGLISKLFLMALNK